MPFGRKRRAAVLVIVNVPHVVIVGAGFGGLRAARGLKDAAVRVTLIDANNFHTFQPLLYQVATAGLDAGDIGFPVRAVVRRQKNATFRLGRVTGIALGDRELTLGDGAIVPYDYLVIAAGSVSATFGVEGVAEHTFALKTLPDALAIRDHLLRLVESSSATDSVDRLGIAVVGGGPTGVEMAGGLRELLDRVLQKDFPHRNLADVPITIVEAADHVLGTFHPSLAERAQRTLIDRGVRVEVGVGVDRVESGAVVLRDGRRIEAATIVWAAGVAANPVAALLGVELGRGGRIPVLQDLSLDGHPEVFAIGDIAQSPTDDGRPLPQVAQPAIQGGRHVAEQIRRRLVGSGSTSFHYRDKGSMATIGRNHAVAEFPNGWRLHSFPGWLSWLGLHIVYLMGFRNRANVLLNWAWNYLTYDRAARLILPSPAEGQPAGRSQ